MNLRTIIDEANIRVPNAFPDDQKIDWLNEVNHEFFDVVKIPQYYSGLTIANTILYTVPSDVREKNIRKVVVGSTFYRSMVYDNITTAFNYYTLNEATGAMTLSPPPPGSNTFIVIYDKISIDNFLAANLTAEPVAPKEYHWLYVLGLCVRLAKAMNDAGMANNYENDFKSNLAVAQQNFIR